MPPADPFDGPSSKLAAATPRRRMNSFDVDDEYVPEILKSIAVVEFQIGRAHV